MASLYHNRNYSDESSEAYEEYDEEELEEDEVVEEEVVDEEQDEYVEEELLQEEDEVLHEYADQENQFTVESEPSPVDSKPQAFEDESTKSSTGSEEGGSKMSSQGRSNNNADSISHSDEKATDEKYHDLEMGQERTRMKFGSSVDKKFKRRLMFSIGGICCCILFLIILLIVILVSKGGKRSSSSDDAGINGTDEDDALETSEAPSMAPTVEPDMYTLNSGPFVVPSFKGALAISSRIGAAGAPDFDGGVVQTYILKGDIFEPLEGVPNESRGRFGAAIDTEIIGGKSCLLVGAPEVLLGGGSAFSSPTEYGAAYFYELIDSEWTRKGSIIIPPEETSTVKGKFGSSVDMALKSNRIIVGAPFAKGETGNAFIYRFNGDWMMEEKLEGETEQDLFGTVVAIADDGDKVLVGAPASERGYIHFYRREGTQWIKLREEGVEVGEGFGSAVAFLNKEGTRFAIASPNALDGKGTVTVFERKDDGFLGQVGNIIVGESQDELGGGGLFGVEDEIVVGTNAGIMKRYRLGRFDEWVRSSVDIDVREPIVAVSSAETFDTLIAGTESGNIMMFKTAEEGENL